MDTQPASAASLNDRADFQATSDPAVSAAAETGGFKLLSYRELYELWERQQWATQDLDFTQDRIDWHERFDEQERFQRERNQLMRRDDVHEMMELVYGIIRDRMNAAPDLIERRNALEPKVVQELIDACDDIVSDVRGAIDKFWRERPVRDGANERRDLFDA
jgi:hypothetical protein